MKAVVKSKQEVGIEILDMPVPKIKPDEVLVQIKACGICGTDIGLYEWRPEDRYRRGHPIKLPKILGHEPAGVVKEVGSEVPESCELVAGDHVASDAWGGCGQCYYCRMGAFNMCLGESTEIGPLALGSLAHGAMTEYCAIPYFSLYKFPDSLTFEEAAVMQPFGVAVRSVETLVLFKPGDDVAILGCGPIGLLQALLAKAAGAGKIFITGLTIDKKRLEIARKLGFTTINAEEQPVRDIILDMTQGLGVDVVFDATTSGVPKQSVPLLKKVGQLCLTSVMEESVTFSGRDLSVKEIIITFPKSRNPSSFRRAINLAASGRIDVKPLITHRFKVEDAEEGFKLLQNREGMKVLIVP